MEPDVGYPHLPEGRDLPDYFLGPEKIARTALNVLGLNVLFCYLPGLGQSISEGRL